MFSAATSLRKTSSTSNAAGPSTSRRSIASATLKKAGLIDGDAKMADGGPAPSRLPLPVKPARTERKRGAFARSGVAEKDQGGMLHPKALRRGNQRDDDNPFTAKAGSSSKTPERGAVYAVRTATTNNHSNVLLLRKFVDGRYDKERKFLNMENLKQDPFWETNKILPPDNMRSAKDVGAVILKLAAQLKPPVETISFANNEFRSLRQFAHLSRYLPNLVNLSLQNNRITLQKDLHYLGGKPDYPPKLREIVFLGNPFHTLAKDNDRLDTYRSELRRYLPELAVIDMEPITKIGFDVPAPTPNDPGAIDIEAPNEFPVAMEPAVLPADTQGITTDFLVKFFPAFDKDRASLINAYAPNATFSFSASTSIPPRARIKRYHTSADLPNQRSLVWEPWISRSRNLSHSRTVAQAARLLSNSATEIVKSVELLPQTHHDVANGGGKFIVDAWLVEGALSPEVSPPNGAALFATVHGEFAELPSGGIRSFDRTFILAPVPPGSPAAEAGWPLLIMSDQLVVRAYSSPEAWAEGPIAVQAPEPESHAGSRRAAAREGRSATPASVPPPPPSNAIVPGTAPIPTDEQKNNLIKGVMKETGLNQQFAIMCLEGNNWHFGQALKNFQELKPTIPPEAYA